MSKNPPSPKNSATVQHIWRFAVKGLDRDSLDSVVLQRGLGLPYDRNWALHFINLPASAEASSRFDPDKPSWVHKQCFLCAFTAPEQLGQLETEFEDANENLIVRDRTTGNELLREQLTTPHGRERVANFFTELTNHERPVQLVSSNKGPHHFGNTPQGFKSLKRPNGHKSGSILHIVNSATVRELSKRAGCEPSLAANRFRPNIVIDGVEPWAEFSWVGKRIRIGGVTLEVIARTIRCEAINVDSRHGTGAKDYDVPALLKQHYPEHGPYFGIYATVVKGGSIQIGDDVDVCSPKLFSPSTVFSLKIAAAVAFAGMAIAATLAIS